VVGFSSTHHREREITSVELNVFPSPAEEDGILCARFTSALGADHPMAEYFRRSPRPVPVRLSDLMPPDRFRATFAYATLFEQRGIHYQIALPIRLSPECSIVYGINRTDVDFSDEELRRVYALQATLSAVHAAAAAARAPHRPVRESSSIRLTPREQDILELLASGMTARAMGRARRISPRTVQKHLESVYYKLDAHDRVLALNRARGLGLLPETIQTPR
jgi:DNA-binding CsgD family transcriptional regulator